MMGACYLTEWTEGLDHYELVGEEILRLSHRPRKWVEI